MRARDMKPDVEYATCDGTLVVPVDPLQRGWMETVHAKNKPARTVFHEATDLDPWGGCMTATRPPDIGILVASYKTDRDGKRIGTGVRTVIPAKDIKGLWVDFMVLHGERVRERADERAEESAQRDLERAIGEMVATVRGVTSILADVRWHYAGFGRARRKSTELRPAVEYVQVTKCTPDELQSLMSRLGVPADDSVRALDQLRDRYMTCGAWQAAMEAVR